MDNSMILSRCFYKSSTGLAYIFWLLHFLLTCKKFLPRGKNQFLVTLNFLIWEKLSLSFHLSVFCAILSFSLKQWEYCFLRTKRDYPPVSEASREVAKLPERTNPHNLVNECFCLLLHKIAILHIFMRSLVYKKLHKFHKFRHYLQLGLYFSALFTMCAASKNVEMGFLDWSQIFNTKITTQTCTIPRGYEIRHTNFTST